MVNGWPSAVVAVEPAAANGETVGVNTGKMGETNPHVKKNQNHLIKKPNLPPLRGRG